MPRVVRNSPFDQKPPDEVSAPPSKSDLITKTGEWEDAFLSAVMQGMSVTDATRAVGVHITTPYNRRRSDEKFREAWQNAAEIGTEFMEQEAARRAYHGTLKPVFHKGIECGHVREYSDTLMIFLLKARKPHIYRDMQEQGKGGGTVSVSVQTNVAAVELLNRMLDDPSAGIADCSPPHLTSPLGDSGHAGEVVAGSPPEADQQGIGEGVADAEFPDGD